MRRLVIGAQSVMSTLTCVCERGVIMLAPSHVENLNHLPPWTLLPFTSELTFLTTCFATRVKKHALRSFWVTFEYDGGPWGGDVVWIVSWDAPRSVWHVRVSEGRGSRFGKHDLCYLA